MDRFVDINTTPLKVSEIDCYYDGKVYVGDKYYSTPQSVAQLALLFPTAQLTDVKGGSVYVNPQGVELIKNSLPTVEITFYSGHAINVTEDIDDVTNALSQAGANIIRQETSTSITVGNEVDIIIATTADISITLPTSPTQPLTVKNNSSGNINVIGTIEGETNGMQFPTESWTLYPYNSNWIII